MTLDRRSFLVLGASLAGGLLTLQLGGCGGGPRSQLAVDVTGLLPPAAAVVGRASLAADDRSTEQLLEVLFRGETWAGLDRDEATQRLAGQVASEHRAGEVVEVRAWRLSRSEAALAALAARLGTGAS